MAWFAVATPSAATAVPAVAVSMVRLAGYDAAAMVSPMPVRIGVTACWPSVSPVWLEMLRVRKSQVGDCVHRPDQTMRRSGRGGPGCRTKDAAVRSRLFIVAEV